MNVHSGDHRGLERSRHPRPARPHSLVTGANGGLGLETARQLAAKGAHVVMAVRNQKKAAAAVDDIRTSALDAALELVALDLASQASVRAAAEQIMAAHTSIDLLINNAGVMGIPEAKTEDGFEMQFAVDHLGHWALTGLLLPALLRTPGARIVTVTSTAHLMGRTVDPANPHLHGRYRPWARLRPGQAGELPLRPWLQGELEKAGASTASLIAHPGLSNTDLQAVSVQQTGGGTSRRFFQFLARRTGMSPADGTLSQLRAATDPAAKGGEFYGPLFVYSGPPVRKPIVRKLGMHKAIAALWEVSERETGIAIDVPAAAAA
jgi:NAD(P)-dependent dehydrogenase (short-subunit alcohol dehydrogenase family)